MIIGYYIFFGNGDYHPPVANYNKEWVQCWNIYDWKKFISKLKCLDINVLFIYLNGHKLPYKSLKFPELVDNTHQNSRAEFLSILLKYAKRQNIKVVGVITTTGHAGGYVELNPCAQVEELSLHVEDDNILISFPEHIRNGKCLKKNGAAQTGFGMLCHNKDVSQNYAYSIIEEIVHFYGDYLDGIALHPPELVCPCYCQICCEIFEQNEGGNLKAASISKAKAFFFHSYIKFQHDVLFPKLLEVGVSNRYTYTIPWFFEASFFHIIQYIPKNVTLIEWDYNTEDDRIELLKKRLQLYRSKGHQLIFMPSAGFSFNLDGDINKQILAVQLQMRLAIEAKVGGIVHFLGPKISQYMLETSIKKLNQTSVSNLASEAGSV